MLLSLTIILFVGNMGKLKKVNNRFYFLAETPQEKTITKLKWDDARKAYYLEDFVKATRLKEFAVDDTTKQFFSYLESNKNGSYGQEPIKEMRHFEDIFAYQARGVQELTMRLHQYRCALLADEQGLGKTIQIAKVIEDMIRERLTEARILIICPASLKLNWKKELFEWAKIFNNPEDHIQVITSSKDWIKEDSDIVVVNYDLLTKEHIQSQLLKGKFYLCVCDEAHYLKNAKAARTKAAATIMKGIQYNIALTGTPILNKPIELYSLLKCLKATDILKPYDTYRPFALRYCNAFDGMWGFDASGASNLEELNFRLRSTIMVRREKKEVLTQLPEKSYQIIPLEADKKAKEICASLSKLNLEQLKDKPELGSVGEIAKLRHELALAKLDDSISHIKDVLEDKDKLVIFAHHKAVIEKLAEALKEFSPVVFDGSTSMTNKNKAVESFQNDAACKVFIGQIQSAGVGITLTAADMVVFVESSWVPGEVEQAVDRCHRIGQKSNVLAQFLTVSGSVDEVMLHSIVKKKSVINSVMK